MDEYENDLAAMDEEAQAAAMEAAHAAHADQKAAEWQARRDEEAKILYLQGQKAKKAALQRHAEANPYAMLEVQGGSAGPPLDFVFASPVHQHPAMASMAAMSPRAMRREDAEWDAALAQDRRIRNREGLMGPFASPPPMHPHHMGPYGHPQAAMPMWEMQRALQQDEHIRQMQVAQAAQQYEMRHHDMTKQQGYQYYRGPHEKHGQRFQPRGHARFGH